MILRNSVIRVYTICNSQHFDQGLHYLPFSGFWSRSTIFAILSGIIRSTHIANLISRSASTLLAILSNLIKIKFHTAILRNSLIRVYTICHSQQSHQGLHKFAILSSLLRVYTVCHLINFYTVYHYQQSYQGLHCLPFSAVWSTSRLFTILSSLIRVYTVCHSWRLIRAYTICQSYQSDQGLHSLRFFLSSIIKVYTVCHSQQFDQDL